MSTLRGTVFHWRKQLMQRDAALCLQFFEWRHNEKSFLQDIIYGKSYKCKKSLYLSYLCALKMRRSDHCVNFLVVMFQLIQHNWLYFKAHLPVTLNTSFCRVADNDWLNYVVQDNIYLLKQSDDSIYWCQPQKAPSEARATCMLYNIYFQSNFAIHMFHG